MSVFTLLRSALQCLQTSLNRPLPWFHYSQRSSHPNDLLHTAQLSSFLQPRTFTPSSFGIAKVLPFLIPTKCFHNFFLSPHFNTLIPTKKFLLNSPPQSPFLSVPINPSDNSPPLPKGFYGYIRDASLLYSAFSPAVMSLHYFMQYSPYHNIRHSYALRHSLLYVLHTAFLSSYQLQSARHSANSDRVLPYSTGRASLLYLFLWQYLFAIAALYIAITELFDT